MSGDHGRRPTSSLTTGHRQKREERKLQTQDGEPHDMLDAKPDENSVKPFHVKIDQNNTAKNIFDTRYKTKVRRNTDPIYDMSRPWYVSQKGWAVADQVLTAFIQDDLHSLSTQGHLFFESGLVRPSGKAWCIRPSSPMHVQSLHVR